jgi:hypothetical protein
MAEDTSKTVEDGAYSQGCKSKKPPRDGVVNIASLIKHPCGTHSKIASYPAHGYGINHK